MPTPSNIACATFASSIGTCAIGWTEAGVAALQLPQRTPESTLHALQKKYRAEAMPAPAWIKQTVELLRWYLRGQVVDLRLIPVDLLDAPAFHRRVYTVLRNWPRARVLTYGELAKKSGAPGGARAVGVAMARNPVPLIIPCHIVVRADNDVGQFSAAGGKALKVQLLALEQHAAASADA